MSFECLPIELGFTVSMKRVEYLFFLTELYTRDNSLNIECSSYLK